MAKKNDRIKQLREKFGTTMTAFPDLKDSELNAILEFMKKESKKTSILD